MSDDMPLFPFSGLTHHEPIYGSDGEEISPYDPRCDEEGVFRCGAKVPRQLGDFMACRKLKLGSCFRNKAPTELKLSRRRLVFFYCYPCEVKYKQELRRRDPEGAKAKDREKYQNNREHYREYNKRIYRETNKRIKNRNRNFNMTDGQYDELFSLQDGLCAICSLPEKTSIDLAVDHDHDCCERCDNDRRSCGKSVRSLLCCRCNMGRFREDAILILKNNIYKLWWRRRHGKASGADVVLLKGLQETLSVSGEDGWWLDAMYANYSVPSSV